MRSSVFWALVRKDVYILRVFSIAGLLTGLAALGIMLTGKVGSAVGGILYLTVNIATGIMIGMYAFVADRKEQSRVFSLSLPISGQRHELAKLVAAFASYGIPWAILTAVAVLVLPLCGAIPKGLMVYGLLIQGCCLALFSLLIACLLVAKTEVLAALTIITTNILFSLFMVTLSQPSVGDPLKGPNIVWTGTALGLLAGELGLIAVALIFAVSIIVRKRDHL